MQPAGPFRNELRASARSTETGIFSPVDWRDWSNSSTELWKTTGRSVPGTETFGSAKPVEALDTHISLLTHKYSPIRMLILCSPLSIQSNKLSLNRIDTKRIVKKTVPKKLRSRHILWKACFHTSQIKPTMRFCQKSPSWYRMVRWALRPWSPYSFLTQYCNNPNTLILTLMLKVS